jgi:hypothetical protein
MSITAIREGLKAALEHLPGEVKVAPGEAKFGNGTDPMKRLVVQVIVGEPSDETEATLDQLLEEDGNLSVCAAIDADRTLRETVTDAIVRSTSGYRIYPRRDAPPLLGAEWQVDYLT